MGRKPQPSSKPVPDFLVKKDRGVNPRGVSYDREINDQMESLKGVGQFAWESLPGVGTVYTVKDIKDELAKEEPNYFLIGALAGAEIIGLIPGLGDAAAELIKKGARSAGKLGSKIDRAVDQTTSLLSKPKAEDSIKTEIIAGPGAKSYSDASLLRAGRLEASGASPAQIEAETGRVKTGTPDDYLDNKPKTLADISPEYKNLVAIRDHIENLIKQISTENSSSAASEIAKYQRELVDLNEKIAKFEKANPADEAGIVVKPQNPFKFEIDDSQIEIRNNDGSQTLAEATKQYPIIVRNIIPDHKELFKEYPNLEYVEFYVDDAATYAHFDPTRGRHGAIVVNPKLKEKLVDPNNKSFRNTFFHELQHAAQFQDERIAFLEQLGGGPTYYGKTIARFPNSKYYEPLINRNEKLVQLKDEILDIFEKHKSTGALDQRSVGATLPGQVPNPSEIFGDVKVAKQIARKMRELDAELFKTYISTASEVEAIIAGKRAKKLGESPTNRIVSDLSNQRNIETREEYSEGKPKSSLGKKKAQAVLKLGSMTDEEIIRYARGGINFASYATGIDKELLGFDASGPLRGYVKGGLAESKGLSWGELIVDNILGLDNEYESFGEKLGKAINEDEIKFLKDAAVGVYEGTKEFVQAPVETTKQVVNEIKDSVTRLGSEDLNTRLQRMYNVTYEQATDEQVNQAREAVLGDALTALELVPAGMGATAVAKAGIAAVPGGLKADVIGQTKAMLSGDREFLSGTPTPKADAQPAGAQVPGMFDRKTPEEMQDYQRSVFDPSPDKDNPAKLMQELQDDTNMSVYDFGIGSDGFLNTAFTPVKIRHGSQVNMRVPIERYLRDTGLYGRISEVAKEVPVKNYLPPSIILDDFHEMVADDILTWYNEMLPHMLADASPEKIFRLAAHLNMYPDRDWRREENRSLIEELAEEIYDEIDTDNLSELKITNPRTVLPDSVKNSEKLKITKVDNDDTGRLVVRPIKTDNNDKYEFYDILGDGADEFKASLKPYLAEGIIDFLENNFERYIPEILENPDTGTSTTRENLLRGVRQEWEQGPNFDLDPLDTLKEIEFKSLGKELLENFKSRVGNKEFVTGAEVLKVLENDPRMNPKTIPNWMKTTEYKNKKIPVADLQGTIDYYSATSPQVSLKNKNRYTGYQRQFGQGFVGGEFKDYVEIIPSTSEKQRLFSDVYSHYGPTALSHTRATVLNKDDAAWKPREAEILGNEDYMLVEEFQSDLVQQGSQDKKKIEYSPIKKSQEALELNIQSLIAEASKRGITKIVIPPFSKIAAARLMGERLDLALQNKSRSRKTGEIVDGNLLYRIYVTELNKALDKFEKSYPITVHRNVELPYQGRPGSTSTVDADELDEFFNLPDDDEIFDAELNDPNVTEDDIITEDQLLNDIAEMMDEDGNITDQIIEEYKEPKPEFIGGGYILDISQMDKEFKLQEPKFAEGGAVGNMNQQMSFAFEDGGLRDDGMRQDPVSGNEVPPGSTAKEVRDDIPAQLSEGEYVVPADVVRYYGVKFFEDLRDNAKMGLQDMEARGRIGGEPVPAGGPTNNDELSAEEMSAIKEMMGMNVGGFVDTPMYNEDPYAQQQSQYTVPMQMNRGGPVRGYQPGGGVTAQNDVSSKTMEDYFLRAANLTGQNKWMMPLGSTIFPDADTGKTIFEPTQQTAETLIYLYGPNGEVRSFTSPLSDADKKIYEDLIAQGYTTEKPETLFEPEQMGSGDDDSPPPKETETDPTGWMDKFDYTDSKTLAEQTLNSLTPAMGGLTGGLNKIGAVGSFINGTKSAQAAANIILLDSQGYDTTSLKQALQTFNRQTGVGSLPEFMINGDSFARAASLKSGILLGKDSVDIFGKPIFKDETDYQKYRTKWQENPAALSNFQTRVATQKAKVAENAETQKAKDAAAAAAALKSAQSNDDDDDPFFVTNVSIDRDPVGQASMSTTYGSGSTAETFSAAEDEIDPSDPLAYTADVNKGGLMNKAATKRKAKRQYKKGGLAGKKK